jgi:hypothetical protein
MVGRILAVASVIGVLVSAALAHAQLPEPPSPEPQLPLPLAITPPTVALQPPPADAKPAPVQVTAKLSNAAPMFGDTILIEVTLRYPSDVRAFFPAKPDLKPFLVDPQDPGNSERQEFGGQVVEKFAIPVIAARSGRIKTPRLEIPWHRVTEAGGAGESGTVAVAPLMADVRSQFATEVEVAPAPMPPPRALEEENTPLEIGLLVLAMMAVAALLTFIGLRVYQSRAARLAWKPKTPPHVLALERLAALFRSGRLDSGEARDVVGELSEILREYLGGRYRLLALDMTTTELLAHLERLDLRGVSLLELRDFAETGDLIKFARMPATAEELKSQHAFVRKVVETTMQTPQELERQREAEVQRLARVRRLRLQVMAPAPLRVRALGIDVAIGAAVTALLAWVAQDTKQQALFDSAWAVLLVWLALRDALGGGSPGKALTGLQIASFQDERPDSDTAQPIGFDVPADLEGAPIVDLAPWSARLQRNLTLLVPGAGLVAEAMTALALPEQRRLGDQWAGTRVVDARHGLRKAKPAWTGAVVVCTIAVVLLVLPWLFGGRPQ